MPTALEQISALQHKLYALQYALNCIELDSSTVAPKKGYTGRGQALEELSRSHHALLTDSGLLALFAEARTGTLTQQQAAELDELERQYNETSRIPADEYAAFSRLTSEAVTVWEQAKATNDFALFCPYLEKIVDTRRRFAAYFDPQKPAYDVWLNQFEKGLTTQRCNAFFDQLKETITPLVAQIVAKNATPPTLATQWPVAEQRQLSAYLMNRLGIDSGHCMIGESEHPFTAEFYKGDVRITTHYHEADFLSSMFSVIHESGHALYELHTGDTLQYTCLAGGATMGLHESQSRLFENCFGRSLPFLQGILPEIQRLFPSQMEGVSAEDLYRAANVCQPSLIRTEADEVTYCLHIMVRYQLEKQLMNGELAVRDLPAAWNAQMQEYLGISVPNDSVGVLQDIHWAGGDFGYFPSYALGSAYAAQMVAKMGETLDLDALLLQGDFAPIREWLSERIWKYGKMLAPDALLHNAFEGEFDPKFYTDYLTKKYSELYDLKA